MATVQPQYARLATQLGVARRAYKRTGALAGAVVFLIEALGTVAIVVAADVLFDLATPGRIALFAIGVVALLAFAYRHVVRPQLRTITDQQIALYLEQRNPQFEGSLIAATEFGPRSYSGRVAEIVDSILDQAVLRAGRSDLRKAIDLTRLRKYGMIAVGLIGIYALAAITMPQAVSRRFARALTPWKPEPKEVDPTKPAPIVLAPLELDVNLKDTSLVRGGTLALQATSNRRSNGVVDFHFRSLAGGGEWKLIHMSETDRLNTFGLTLPDVNEDLEYFVSAENAKTEPHRVRVYDPLVVRSYEVVTRYPGYLGFADRTEAPSTPDVAAPVGSMVTVRAVTNGQLKGGTFTASDNAATPVTAADAQAQHTFEVKRSDTFTFSLTDVHGQTVTTPTAASITAIVDRPPAIKLLAPRPQASSNPLGEIGFAADVTDDLALASAELVVLRGVDPSAKPLRLPMKLDGETVQGLGMTAGRATGTLMLEAITPPLEPGELVMAYVEAKDKKGQAMAGELVQITITTYESWAVFNPASAVAGGSMASFQLEPVLQAAWRLYATSGQLAPNQVDQQAEEIAATMLDPNGKLLLYFNPEKITDPQKLKHGANAMKLAQAGHDSLAKHDLEKAVAQLRAAVAELVAAGVIDVVVVNKPPEGGGPQQDAKKMEQAVGKLTALVEKTPPAGAKGTEAKSEQDKAAEAAEQMAKAEQLERDAGALAEKLNKAAQSKDGSEKKGAADAEKLADKAAGAAKQTKDAAGTNEAKKGAAQDLADAAANLKAAADAGKQGKADAAAAKADAAKRNLAAAKGKLAGASQDNVNAALDKAERAAQAAARKQGELMKRTEAAGKAGDQKKGAAGQVAQEQVKLNNDLKDLANAVDGLNKAGAAGAVKPDTAKHIQKAADDLKKARLDQKVANAAVKLAAGDTAGAAAEQKKIKDALENVGNSLKGASGTRAGDAATALKRAKDEAAAAKADLDKLQGKGAEAGGAGKQPGKDEKKELAAKAADELARLVEQIKQRDMSGGDQAFTKDSAALAEATKDPAKLSDELENAPARLGELAKLTGRVKDHLEAAYESNLKSRELFAAQREECPPEYRPLVNKYFESIANDGK